MKRVGTQDTTRFAPPDAVFRYAKPFLPFYRKNISHQISPSNFHLSTSPNPRSNSYSPQLLYIRTVAASSSNPPPFQPLYDRPAPVPKRNYAHPATSHPPSPHARSPNPARNPAIQNGGRIHSASHPRAESLPRWEGTNLQSLFQKRPLD